MSDDFKKLYDISGVDPSSLKLIEKKFVDWHFKIFIDAKKKFNIEYESWALEIKRIIEEAKDITLKGSNLPLTLA